MGLNDYNKKLYPVYRHCTDASKMHCLPFHFEADKGNYETAIVFNVETGGYRPKRLTETWNDIRFPELMLCPDVCDYANRIIIEFEEETGNRRPGARLARKGHHRDGDYLTKRDSRRNDCYKTAGFALHRIWESAFKKNMWKIALTEFLFQCYRKKLTDSMTFYDPIPNIEK